MNPDTPQTPQEQIEARLTALLLGELTPHEAASLHEAIQNDARLGELYNRLKETIALVRETAASPAGQTAAQPAPLKLSEDRRQKLLAQFKTVEPKEFVEARRREKFNFSPLLTAAAVLMLTAVLAVMLLPALSRAKAKAVSVSVRGNLKQVEIAKEMWASDNAKSAGDAVTLDDLKPYLGEDRLRSIAGEKYVPGRVGDPAVAEVDAAHAKKSFGRLPNGQPPGDGREKLVRLSENGEISFVDKSVAENTLAGTTRESKVEDFSQTVTVRAPQESSSPKRAEIFLPSSNAWADAAKAPDTKPGFDFSLNSTEQNKLAYVVKSKTDLGADVADFTNGGTRVDTWNFEKLGPVQTPALVSGGVAENANLHFFRDLNGNVGTNTIGDPQWAGILDHPENTNSGTNQFVARYAFTSDIKPGLDIDFVSNQAAATTPAVSPPVESPAVTLGANGALGGGGGFGGGRGGRRAPVAAPAGSEYINGNQAALAPASVPPSVIDPNTGLPVASAWAGKPDQKSELTSGLRSDSFGLAHKDILIDGGNAAKSTTHGAANIGKSEELATNRRRTGEDGAGKAPILAELPTLGRAFKSDSFAATDTSAMVTNGIVLPQVTESEQGKETPPKLRDYVPLQSRFMTVISPQPPESKAELVGLTTNLATPLAMAANTAAAPAASEGLEKGLEKTPEISIHARFVEITNSGQITAQLKDADRPLPRPATPPPAPQPEVQTRENAFSTFSLNVSRCVVQAGGGEPGKGHDAGRRPRSAARSSSTPSIIAIPSRRRARRLVLRGSARDIRSRTIATCCASRSRRRRRAAQPGRPLNIVLLLDNSGSMERADRVQIIHEALRVLAAQLQPQDKFSVVTFARTARLVGGRRVRAARRAKWLEKVERPHAAKAARISKRR